MEAAFFDPGPIEHVFKTSFPHVSNYDWIETRSADCYRPRWLKVKLGIHVPMLRQLRQVEYLSTPTLID